jgi:hypothetical protein
MAKTLNPQTLHPTPWLLGANSPHELAPRTRARTRARATICMSTCGPQLLGISRELDAWTRARVPHARESPFAPPLAGPKWGLPVPARNSRRASNLQAPHAEGLSERVLGLGGVCEGAKRSGFLSEVCPATPGVWRLFRVRADPSLPPHCTCTGEIERFRRQGLLQVRNPQTPYPTPRTPHPIPQTLNLKLQ